MPMRNGPVRVAAAPGRGEVIAMVETEDGGGRTEPTPDQIALGRAVREFRARRGLNVRVLVTPRSPTWNRAVTLPGSVPVAVPSS